MRATMPPWVALGLTAYEWNHQGQPQPKTEERTEEEKPDLAVDELHALGEGELVEEVAVGTA